MQFGDVVSLTTADGIRIEFDNQVFALRSSGNWGAPPTSFITRQGYKQHGVTEVDFQLQTRDLPLQIYRVGECDRQIYWDNRAELLNFLRPNRGGPLTLTVQTPDGLSRSILVRANPGTTFQAAQNDNSFSVDEEVEFLAFSPLWFDEESTTLTMTAAVQQNLIFPITFPISFGTSVVFLSSGLIQYVGSWSEYPILTLTGPYDSVTIFNEQTDAAIYMNTPLAAGSQRILDLTPGSQRITDGSGNNKFSDLGPNSDLVNFNLRPDPEVAGGQQEITIGFQGGTSQSAAQMSYRNRYFGI
ncbi:MAG: hypothetical protein ABI690_13585 [Chloroflexota bacterium]